MGYREFLLRHMSDVTDAHEGIFFGNGLSLDGVAFQ